MSGRQTQKCTALCLVDLRLVLLLATNLEVLASLRTAHTTIHQQLEGAHDSTAMASCMQVAA